MIIILVDVGKFDFLMLKIFLATITLIRKIFLATIKEN